MAEADAGSRDPWRARAEKVWSGDKVTRWRQTLDGIWTYILPFRRGNNNAVSQQEPNVDEIFDGTGASAAVNFVNRMLADVTPTYERFFALKPGPAIQDEVERSDLQKQFDVVADVAEKIIFGGGFDVGASEMYLDLFAGQGAMLMLDAEGTVNNQTGQVSRFLSVPSGEIALIPGGWNDPGGVVWKRNWPGASIMMMWPKGRYDEQTRTNIENDPDKEIETLYVTYWEKQRWRTRVWLKDQEAPIVARNTDKANPWLTPRMYVAPGWTHGFGPAHIALPFIKTANVAREMALKAAAFSLLGVWAQRNDNIFNPDTAQFIPGNFLPVGSTGGTAMGPTLSRLDIPHDFDISTIVIEDERMQIKRAAFDNQLPPETGAVRSPTEIVERMKQLHVDWGGVDGRINRELIGALVTRATEIAARRNLLPGKVTIDQLWTQMEVLSPLARSRRASALQPVIEGVSLLQSIGGDDLARVVMKLDDIGADLVDALGVKAKHVHNRNERKAIRNQMAEQVQQMMAMQQQQQGAPAQ